MATTVNFEEPLHDYGRILVTTEGVAGSLGFILNAGVLLILLRHKDRKALLTMTMSLSISDMLTGLFHTFVLIYPELNFQDYGTNDLLDRAFMRNLAGLEPGISNTSNNNGSWSFEREMSFNLYNDFDFGDVFDSPKTGVFYQSSYIYDTLNTTEDMENFMNDVLQEKIKTLLEEFKGDRQTDINNTSMERFNFKLSQYEIAIVIVHCLYIIPYISCILNMLGISLCLLIIVTQPLKHRSILTQLRVKIYICITWALAIISSMAPCIYVLLVNIDFVKISFLSQSLMAATTVSNLTILVALAIIYCIILFSINCRKNVPLSSHKRHSSSKSVATAITIIGSYFICYQPIIWTFVFEDIVKRKVNFNIWIRILPLFAAFNTTIDALVYAFRLESVSQTVLSTLLCVLNVFKRKQPIVKGRRNEQSIEEKTAVEMPEPGSNVTKSSSNHSDKI